MYEFLPTTLVFVHTSVASAQDSALSRGITVSPSGMSAYFSRQRAISCMEALPFWILPNGTVALGMLAERRIAQQCQITLELGRPVRTSRDLACV